MAHLFYDGFVLPRGGLYILCSPPGVLGQGQGGSWSMCGGVCVCVERRLSCGVSKPPWRKSSILKMPSSGAEYINKQLSSGLTTVVVLGKGGGGKSAPKYLSSFGM